MQSKARAEAMSEELRTLYRQGDRTIRTSKQNIVNGKGNTLAKRNAQVTANEIKYLRQQLVIGGSTLDSVLSAEARLYEAESKKLDLSLACGIQN